MGWNIALKKNAELVSVPGHQTGSNLMAEVKDGEVKPVDNNFADCTITYNYSKLFKLADFFMSDFNHQVAKDTIPMLEAAINKLGTDRYEDYWAPTPGNAGAALQVLLEWARLHPEAVWDIV